MKQRLPKLRIVLTTSNSVDSWTAFCSTWKQEKPLRNGSVSCTRSYFGWIKPTVLVSCSRLYAIEETTESSEASLPESVQWSHLLVPSRKSQAYEPRTGSRHRWESSEDSPCRRTHTGAEKGIERILLSASSKDPGPIPTVSHLV